MSPVSRAQAQEEHEQSLLALEANHADPGCESIFAVCAAKQVPGHTVHELLYRFQGSGHS